MITGELVVVLGRVLLGGLFVVAGIRHFFVMPAVLAPMTARGIPRSREVLVAGSIFEIAAGMLLVLGIFTVWTALGLALFTIVASWMLLDFWNKQGPPRHGAINGLLGNAGVIGGLLIVAASGL